MKLGRDEGKVVTLTEKWRKSTIGKGISLREGEGGGKEMTFDDQRDILHFVLILLVTQVHAHKVTKHEGVL